LLVWRSLYICYPNIRASPLSFSDTYDPSLRFLCGGIAIDIFLGRPSQNMNSPGMMGRGNDGVDTLGDDVRNWLHYDGLTTTFFKQSSRARQVRDEYEQKIIQSLAASKMENAVIQISNGRIHVIEERNPRNLTLQNIETLLHGYFAKRGGKDETVDIINHVRGHRGVDTKKRLKKTMVHLPPLPPLPPKGV